MATNEETIQAYEASQSARATAIQNKKAARLQKEIDLLNLQETIDTAKASLRLEVLSERFEINNALKYTNETERRAALQQKMDTDADYQLLATDAKTIYAQEKTLEAEIEYENQMFSTQEIAMRFYSNNP